jgi:hypothetical protein
LAGGGWRQWDLRAAAVRARGDTEDALERPAERGLALVARPPGDLPKAEIGRVQQAGRMHQAGADEIAHRRLADQLAEPRGERRTRQRDLGGQAANGPRPLRLPVDELHRGGDVRVAKGGPIDTFDNADAYVQAIQGLSQIVTGADKRRVFVDGNDVCVIYDLKTARFPAHRPPSGTASEMTGSPRSRSSSTPGRSPPCSRAARACYIRRRSQWSMTAMWMVAA